jgi:hypothetical protein
MLSEGRISQVSQSIALQVGQNIDKLKPTSIYSCATCKQQLFTNLDIQFHEREPRESETLSSREWHGGALSSRHQKRRGSHGDLIGLYDDEDKHEVATIVNFSYTRDRYDRSRDS